MIRVVLPAHLRTLAQVGGEVALDVGGAVTLRAVLDALEARYPMLRGTIRDHVTRERRPFVRFFACEQDLSHDPPDTPLPAPSSRAPSRSSSSARWPADSVVPARSARGLKAVVVGAGAFGGWTALELRRRGARVTLVDAWGPGNARASSGGETRVIRATYGSRTIYTKMAVRAMALWRAHDAKCQRGFFRKTGALWMFGDDDCFGRASAVALRAEKLPIEELTPDDAATRFPQIAFDGTVRSVLWEPEAGYLFARRACEHVVECFIAEGGEYRQSAVPAPVSVGDSPLQRVALDDGTMLEADAFVFACGPWLGRLFPDVVGKRVTPTRQEVYYFGTPPGDTRFLDPAMPVWVDYRERLIYGIPGNANRGFKVADDTPGPGVRSDRRRARRDACRHRGGARVPGAALSGAGRGAAARLGGLPVRGLARLALHHRPASGGRERLDRRRRIGARLQDGPGNRRAGRVAGARRERARPGVSPGALRRVARRWLANPLVVAEFLRQQLTTVLVADMLSFDVDCDGRNRVAGRVSAAPATPPARARGAACGGLRVFSPRSRHRPLRPHGP